MGTLYLVATPIGNLGDITHRAIEVLKNVDILLCEDTRVTGKLLNAFQIKQRMISFNDFNEEKQIPKILKFLLEGKKIALVSDSGTPLISDPGFKLVREVIRNNIKVESVPGACAAITSLTISGLPSDKFLFLGYLPKKELKRKEVLKKTKEILRFFKITIIIYESPYRLLKTLNNISEIFGTIHVVICRELTKLHEEIRRENITQAMQHFSLQPPKGEVIILF